MGGFKLVTNGDNSRHGDVSLELAVLDPPPLGECTLHGGAWNSSKII